MSDYEDSKMSWLLNSFCVFGDGYKLKGIALEGGKVFSGRLIQSSVWFALMAETWTIILFVVSSKSTPAAFGSTALRFSSSQPNSTLKKCR